MYPKLWEASEVKYSRLIEKLVDLGLERHRARAGRANSAMEWLDKAKRLT
jgi:D-alanine-D-alanine ligase